MIRPKLPLRRPLAILGATFLGLTAALAVAAPASAHHSEVKVVGECNTTTGQWDVTWTIHAVAPGNVPFKFKNVQAKSFVGATASDMAIPGIEVSQGQNYPHQSNQDLVFTQSLPAETTGVELKVKAQWQNNHQEDKFAGAGTTFAGTCEKKEEEQPKTPNPTASVGSECDGSVVVTLKNGEEATAPAEFTVTGPKGFEENVSVPAGETKTVKVPAENAGAIKVTEKSQDKPLFDATPAAAEDCVEPGEPSLSYAFTCDEFVWEVDNPEDGKSVTVTFTPNKGEPKTVTVEPGKVETVKFPVEEGLTVTPGAEGQQGEPIAWEKPEECTQGGGGGGDEELPLTGAAAGGIAIGAAVLLVAGVVLFFVARRRRVTFTA